MERKVIKTKNSPGAIGPYSQGIEIGNLIFTSGQLPINPADNKLITDDIQKATNQALQNVSAILEAAGSSIDKVIKVTVFLKDLNDFAAMNEVYSTFFKEEPPARSCIQIAKLPLDAPIEIEVIASK